MKRYSLKERLFAMLLCIVMVVGMVPTTAFAVETGLATVEILTDGFTVGENGNHAAEMRFTYAGTPTWVPANPSIGRNEEGWWVGLKVVAPADVSEDAGYNYGSGAFNSFEGKWDSAEGAEQKHVGFWFLIKPEYLRTANQTNGLATYVRCFDWNGDGVADQTLVVDVDADQVTLKKDDQTVYPFAGVGMGKVTALTDGAEQEQSMNTTTVTYANTKLQWSEADASEGRTEDGWWVGVRIDAPEGMTKQDQFSNVTYQNYGTTEWSSAKSFWDAQSSDKSAEDTTRFLTMWCLVTPELIKNDSDGLLPFKYRFDWNGDGLYEQDLIVQVDTSDVILMKGNSQYYPVLWGRVEATETGVVTKHEQNDEVAKTYITIEGPLVLNTEDTHAKASFSAKVVLPEDMRHEDQLKNAWYYSSAGEAQSIAAMQADQGLVGEDYFYIVYSFAQDRASEMFGTAEPCYTATIKWRNEEARKQYVYFTISPDAILEDENGVQLYPELGKVESLNGGNVIGNTSGKVEVTVENATLIYTEANVAEGISTAGWWAGIKVTAPENVDLNKAQYREADGEATAFGETAALQLWKQVDASMLNKDVVQTWWFDWDGNGAFEQVVTLTLKANSVLLTQNMGFVKSEDSAVYGEEYTLQAVTGDLTGKNVSYSVSDSAVATVEGDKLVFLKAGEITVTATVTGEHYAPATISYTLKVNKAQQPDFGFVEDAITHTWQADAVELPEVKGELSEGALTWNIVGESDVAEIVEGVLQLKKQGVFTLEVQKQGDDRYESSAVASITVTVNTADQKWIGFGNQNNKTVVYGTDNNKLQLAPDAGTINTAITYCYHSGDNTVATVDANGMVTIFKSGTVAFRAIKAGNDQYAEDYDEFTLTVKKAENPFAFTSETVQVTYGTLTVNDPNPLVDNKSEGSIQYEYMENTIGLTVDENGALHFVDSSDKVGKATVQVTVAADDCYEKCTKTYEVEVTYLAVDKTVKPYIDDEKHNGWYNKDVTIKAPESYQISYTNIMDGEWAEKVVFTTEGKNQTAKVYLKNEAGHITDAQIVADINLDKTSPGDLRVDLSPTAFDVILSEITFGVYEADSVTVSVYAGDDLSQMAYLYYKLHETDEFVRVATSGNSASHSLTLDADDLYEVSMKAEDVAGNVSELKWDGTKLVLDTTDPVITAGYSFGENDGREENDIYYAKGAVTVTFQVNDANFNLSGLEKLNKNGEKTALPVVTISTNRAEPVEVEGLTWSESGEAIYTLAEEGDHVLTVTYTDPSGNIAATYTKQVNISDEIPVIALSMDKQPVQTVEEKQYFGTIPTMQVQITSHNFKAENVVLTVAAEDIEGNVIAITDYSTYASNSTKWTKDEDSDVWTLNTDGMVFGVQANYTVTVNYEDKVGNVATEKAMEFAYDCVASKPENVKITYSDTISDAVINDLTFGFFRDSVLVEIEIVDDISGIETIDLFYNRQDGASVINRENHKAELEVKRNGNKFTASYEIPAQARGTVYVNYADYAGNSNTTAAQGKPVLVVDNKKPGRKITFSTPVQVLNAGNMTKVDSYTEGDDVILYYRDSAEVFFEIEEANFDLSKDAGKLPVVKVSGEPVAVEWTKSDENLWVASYAIQGNGDYVVTMEYTDMSGNAMTVYTSCPIHVDDATPEITVEYVNGNPYQTVDDVPHYNTAQTIKVQIAEHNFRAEDVELTVTAESITHEVIGIEDYSAYAKLQKNWVPNGDVWTLNTEGMELDVDARYTFDISYSDLCGNAAVNSVTKEAYETDVFVYDSSVAVPKNVKITYNNIVPNTVINELTFGFFKEEVLVEVEIEDDVSGIETIDLFYNRQDNASTTNLEACKAALEVTPNGNKFTASYVIPAQARGTVYVNYVDFAGNKASTENLDNPVIVVDEAAPGREVSFTGFSNITDTALMDKAEHKEGDKSILYFKEAAVVNFKITESNFDLSLANKDDQPAIKVNGEPVLVEWNETTKDVWEASYTIEEDGDYVVTMEYVDLSGNAMVDYTSCELRVDSAKPVIFVSYLDGKAFQTVESVPQYNTEQTIMVQIEEHNFRAEDVVLTVAAESITGEVIGIADYSDYAKRRENWHSNGDIWTLNTDGMKLNTEARYEFDIKCADIAGNESSDYAEDALVYDKTIAEPADVKITYNKLVPDTIFDKITFGIFQENVLVEIEIEDDISGIEVIDLFYNRQDGASEINRETLKAELKVKQDGNKFSASYTIPAEARGKVYVNYADFAGNKASTEKLDNPVIVVDNKQPGREVTYSDVVNVVDAKTMLDTEVDNYKEGDDSILYFKDSATVNFKINEANFDLSLAGNAKPVIKVNGVQVTVNWDKVANTDEWVATHIIEAAGHYVVTMEYVDLSGNAMVDYTSCELRVDDKAPEILVSYTEQATNSVGNVSQYNTERVASVKIKEHNFRADDVVLTVVAKDINGNELALRDYSDYAKARANWIEIEPDVWQLKTEGTNFEVEGRYTVQVEYIDLAKRVGEGHSEEFVYDKTIAKPESVEITYEEVVRKDQDDNVNFFKDDVLVTVKMVDTVSGIKDVNLTYTLQENVGKGNKETFTESMALVQDETDRSRFVATFVIEAQARGTISIDYADHATNADTTAALNNPITVVDNIAPVANIRYNAPVQTSNNVSYYSGSINATIEMKEANFYSEDVVLNVTRNGAVVNTVVHWNSIDADNHVGTFTLNDEGDYMINVRYTDRSGNVMTEYTSNQLTVDVTAPAIKVSNIKANTANKDETYGFVIEISDINLDVSAMKPVLKTVVQENGVYKTKEIDLGSATTVVAGQIYTYTVDNLLEDGLYTLTCEAKDLAANTTNEIELEDTKLYEQVQFSINRNGSAFGYGNAFTENLNSQYYVYSVDEDVVLVEVNVDPIEDYRVELNGKELIEDTDYVSEQTSNAGEWSKRTYRINKALFEAEGEYNIIIASTDKAATSAYSDIKNLTVAFVVDKSKPVLTINGLTTGGRYQTDAQIVTLIPTDEGGRLQSLKVTVMDSDGRPLANETEGDISIRFEMSGDKLLQFLADNEGKVTFTIPEGLNNQVRIICNDCAINAENETNTYDELFTRVTVSRNQLIIFYANKPAFYGTIAGVLSVIALIVVLINRKKKVKV